MTSVAAASSHGHGRGRSSRRASRAASWRGGRGRGRRRRPSAGRQAEDVVRGRVAPGPRPLPRRPVYAAASPWGTTSAALGAKAGITAPHPLTANFFVSALHQAGQQLVCTTFSATMPSLIMDPASPGPAATTNECTDLCSPPARDPETDHLSLPPDSSGASESSDEEWKPSGSECDSQCQDTCTSNRADDSVVTPRLPDPGDCSDLQDNAVLSCDQRPEDNGASRQEDGDPDVDQTYAGLLTNLFCEQRDACNWTTGSLTVTFCTSLSDDSPRDIDIAPTIGHGKNVPKTCNDSNCHWLQSHLNRNDKEFREKHVYPIFIKACHAAGFRVFCKYVKRHSRFQVMCCRGVYHREGDNKKHTEELRQKYVPSASTTKCKKPPNNAKKTQRPIHPSNFAQSMSEGDDDFMEIDLPCADDQGPSDAVSDTELDNTVTCKFKFSVYWDDRPERWMIPHYQRGCISHSGHPKIKPEHLRVRGSIMLDEQNINVVNDSFASKIRATSARNLMETRTGHTLHYHQIMYLGRRQAKEESRRQGFELRRNTVVDNLVAGVTQDPLTSWVMLLAERESDLITIKMRRKTAGKAAAEMIDFAEDLGDLLDSPLDHAESLRDRLMTGDSGGIMLAFAWAGDESRRKFDMFPESFGEDDTTETNNEERDLHTIIGKDHNNQIYSVLNCFMPCLAQWAFSWVGKLPCLTFILARPCLASRRLSLMQTGK